MAHLAFLYVHEVCGTLVYGLAAKPYVEHLPLAHDFGVLGEEEGYLGKLDGQSDVGVNHIARDELAVPVAEHTAGHVDRHYFGARLVDVACQRHESAHKRFAQTGAEHAVYHHVARLDFRCREMLSHDLYQGVVAEAGAYLVAPAAAFVAYAVASDVEQEHGGFIAHPHQEYGCGESVGAVVARACEHYYALRRSPAPGYGAGRFLSRALHQSVQRDPFFFYCGALYGAYFFCGKELHCLNCCLRLGSEHRALCANSLQNY